MRKLVVVAGMLLLTILAFGDSPKKAALLKPLTLEEAEILVYLTPVAHEYRNHGVDVSAEFQPQASKNDRYVFWLQNAKQNRVGSSTIGYYSVGKFTGDVRDDDSGKAIETPELSGVRAIALRAHELARPEKN